MGRLQIEDGVHQQEEEIDSNKEEESPLGPPPPSQLEQRESSQGLPREWNLSQIIRKIKLLVIHQLG